MIGIAQADSFWAERFFQLAYTVAIGRCKRGAVATYASTPSTARIIFATDTDHLAESSGEGPERYLEPGNLYHCCRSVDL